MRHAGALAGLTLFLAGWAAAAPAPDAPARLAAMAGDYWEEYLALNPTLATSIGDHRYDDRMGIDIGEDHRARSRALHGRYLAEARALDATALDARQRETLALFIAEQERALAYARLPWHLVPFNQMNSTPLGFAGMGSGESIHPFATVRDYENFLARIGDFLRWSTVAVENMREGIRKGIVLPRVLVERMIPQMAGFVVDAAEDSVYWQPVANMPAGFPDAERERLAAAYREAIMDRLVPTYAALGRFLEEEYLPAARESVGLSELPGGDAWYDALVAWHTTTPLPAETLHRVGLEEVARIRAEMEGVRGRVGFEGDLAEFFVHLKTHPGFFWDSAEAVLADYRAVQARVDRGLPALFDVAPRAGFEIRPTPEFRAGSAASAEYEPPSADGARPGVFYLNTWDLSRLARWGMETLFLHEAIPGHHFQSAIAQELEGVPDFRRFSWYTAYTEGWALYAEDLGRELGLFEDPYQYFGKLNDEMLRAMRLVVDTGLHRYGWTREEAIGYMQDNSSLPEAEIVAEVERYIAWPGQALAYKAGQLELRALREEAAAALGEDFDLAAWHGMVLSGGEMPLDLLRERSRRWVAERATARRQPVAKAGQPWPNRGASPAR